MATTRVNDNFKAGLIEAIKTAGHMIVNMADDIAGTSNYISGLTVSANFNPEFRSIPEITITRSHLPDQEKMERILDIFDGERSKEADFPHIIDVTDSYDVEHRPYPVYAINVGYTWDDLTDDEKRAIYDSQRYLLYEKERKDD